MEEKKKINRQGFLKFLSGLSPKSDRGTLAELRKGFSETTETRSWPHIAKYCDLTNDRDRTILLTIAAGCATLKGDDEKPQNQKNDEPNENAQAVGAEEAKETPKYPKNYQNMGAVFRKIALVGAENPDEALKSFDVYFRRILACDDVQDACPRLRSLFLAAKTKGVELETGDWEQALGDLIVWGKKTKTSWAAQYWGVDEDAQKGDPTDSDAEEGA